MIVDEQHLRLKLKRALFGLKWWAEKIAVKQDEKLVRITMDLTESEKKMSTGADCVFIEKGPGVWFYEIQHYPYGETEDYDRHGPFKSEEEADNHLSVHYANPGGYAVERYEEK